MKENFWTKTLLGIYSYLETIADAIDKITMKTALSSFQFSRLSLEKNNVLTISNKLIDLSERKVTLINLKLLIEKTLLSLPKKDAILLIHRYINKSKATEISQKSGMSVRSVFRKLHAVEDKFVFALSKQGYDNLKLKDMLKNEHWILNYYNDLATKKAENFSFSGGVEKLVAL